MNSCRTLIATRRRVLAHIDIDAPRNRAPLLRNRVSESRIFIYAPPSDGQFNRLAKFRNGLAAVETGCGGRVYTSGSPSRGLTTAKRRYGTRFPRAIARPAARNGLPSVFDFVKGSADR